VFFNANGAAATGAAAAVTDTVNTLQTLNPAQNVQYVDQNGNPVQVV